MSNIKYLNLDRKGSATLSDSIESRNHVTLKVMYCKGEGEDTICFGRTKPSKFFSFDKIDFVIYNDTVYLSEYSYSGNKIIRDYNDDYRKYKNILDERFLADRAYSTPSEEKEEDASPEDSSSEDSSSGDITDTNDNDISATTTPVSDSKVSVDYSATKTITSLSARFLNKEPYAAGRITFGYEKNGIIEFEATFPDLEVVVTLDDDTTEIMNFNLADKVFVYDGTIDSKEFKVNRDNCVVVGFYSDKFSKDKDAFKNYLLDLAASITIDDFGSNFDVESGKYKLPISKDGEHFVTFSKIDKP